MKVLLISPQGGWVSFDREVGAGNRDFGENLGIRYVAAVARRQGHEVELIDAHFQGISRHDAQRCVDEHAGSPPDLIGVSAIEHTIPLLVETVAACRRVAPKAFLVAGGYAASFWWKELLERIPALDAVVCGEGELTFEQLLLRLGAGANWRDLKGMAYRRQDGVPIGNPPREPCDLNALPWPVRDDCYPYGHANILSSRGCYGTCTFCSIIRFYKSGAGKVRVRDAGQVVAEIADLHARGVRHIDFVDDNFVSGAKQDGWVDEFCAGMAQLPRRITFGVQMRPDDVQEPMLRALRRAGLKIVSIGVESDLEEQLRLFGKRTTKKINRAAITILNRLGLDVYVEMLLFNPTSTLPEIAENVAFMKEIRYWNYVRVTPATFLHELQLYRGIPLLRYYDELGLVRPKPDGFGYSYTYRDPEVPIFLARLRRWRKYAGVVANHHLAYYQFPLAARGDCGTAMRAIHLSRAFLKYDLDVFSALLTSVMEGASAAAVEAWMEEQRTLLDSFKDRFLRIARAAPERVAYIPEPTP